MDKPSCVVVTRSGSVYTLAYGDPDALSGLGVTLRRCNPAADFIVTRNGEFQHESSDELMLDRVAFCDAPILGEAWEIVGERNGKHRVVTTTPVTDYTENEEFFL